MIDWLRSTAPHCQWTASVCTGAGLYAAAGLLEGKTTTTTHWGFWHWSRGQREPNSGLAVGADPLAYPDTGAVRRILRGDHGIERDPLRDDRRPTTSARPP